MHFLKQELRSFGPDPCVFGTLGRHSGMSRNECPKLPGQGKIFYPPFTLYTQCAGTGSQEVSDHNVDCVWARFSGRCYLFWHGTGNRAVPFSPVWVLDVAHRDCLSPWTSRGYGGFVLWLEESCTLPRALPWVVILNVNCYKLWAITSLVSQIYYQQPVLPIDLKVVLLYITTLWSHISRLQWIAAYHFFQRHRSFMTQLSLAWLLM